MGVLKKGLTIRAASPLNRKLYVVGVLVQSAGAGCWIGLHYHYPWREFMIGSFIMLLAAVLFTWLLRWGLMNAAQPAASSVE